MTKKLFSLLTVMVISASAFAQTASAVVSEEAKQNATDASYVLCKNKATVRTIRVEKEKGLCVTTYTKEGVDQIVGQGQAENTCFGILNNIKGNLEKADWKCKDISQARISSSEG